MKILYLIDTLEVGGAETSLLEIVKRSKNTSPVVCSIYSGASLRPAFEKAGIPVICLGLKGKHRYIKAVKKVLSLIQRERFQLIETSLSRSHLVGRTAGRLAGLPVISLFTSEPFTLRRYARISRTLKLKVKAFELLDRFTLRWVSHFIANSEFVKDSACKKLGISRDKVSVIYRGRDPSLLNTVWNDVHDPVVIRKSEGIPTILSVGRLVPEKSHKDLINAMVLIRRQMPVRLLIAGEGKGRDELAVLIRKLNLTECVTLLGYRNDAPQLMRTADVFAFPSISEGHPGVLVEAMFAGCPIVASDIPVHKEMIDNRKTGLLFAVGNTEELANAISWVLTHLAEAFQMTKQAREVAFSRFHIDQVAKQHEELCFAILNHRNSNQGKEQ